MLIRKGNNEANCAMAANRNLQFNSKDNSEWCPSPTSLHWFLTNPIFFFKKNLHKLNFKK